LAAALTVRGPEAQPAAATQTSGTARAARKQRR
jgi:hypothetical protein